MTYKSQFISDCQIIGSYHLKPTQAFEIRYKLKAYKNQIKNF